MVVVSPHFDDAIWSTAEHILTWQDEGASVEILVVYGGIPEDDLGAKRVNRYLEEHLEACGQLGVTAQSLLYLDDIYCPRPDVVDIAQDIRDACSHFNVVVGPTGIHHPDHQRVAAVMADMGAWRYDELPYYVEYPQQSFRPGNEFVMVNALPGHLETKMAACRCYESQMHEKEERTLWVPERVWKPKG
jgi:LmbE family N-acetylglucosaminyl deacetylase